MKKLVLKVPANLWKRKGRLLIFVLFLALVVYEISNEFKGVLGIINNNIYISINTVQSKNKTHVTKKKIFPRPPPLCTRKQMYDGKWESAQVKQPPYIMPDSTTCDGSIQPFVNQDQKKNAYGDDNSDSQQPRPLLWDTYDWIPKHQTDGRCLFSKWDPMELCALMNRSQIRKVLFTGDSIIREMFMSLIGLYGWKGTKNDVFNGGGDVICHRLNRTGIHISFKYDVQLKKLAGNLRKQQPQLVVANRGVHYESNNTIFADGISRNILEFQSWQRTHPICTTNAMGCLLIWKTSVPGHPNCRQYTKPINNLEEMEFLTQNMTHYQEHPEYGWYAQKEQNSIVLSKLSTYLKSNDVSNNAVAPSSSSSSSSQFDVEIVDAYPIQIRRPDSHTDCLHSCLPNSKTDTLNQMLLHLFRLRAEKARHS